MLLRNASILKPILAVLAMAMLAVALACASEEPTATPAPTDPPPTATPPTTIGQPTPTPVPDTLKDLTWMERYLESPGYDEAWGQPVTGGTFIFGAQLDVNRFTPANQGCCYYHGCYRGLPWNSLFRIDPWTGDLSALIEGDLVDTWEMSADGKTLTMQLQEGVTFFHDIPADSPLFLTSTTAGR